MSRINQIGGSHYQRELYDTLQFANDTDMPFAQGCIVKYIQRHRYMGGLTDLQKAKSYAQSMLVQKRPRARVDPDYSEEYIEWLSDRLEKFIRGLSQVTHKEAFIIRLAATAHILPTSEPLEQIINLTTELIEEFEE